MSSLDIDIERERIARRRKLAEAMLTQSQQPMGGTEMVSGIAVRRSPIEGIAKVAQAYAGTQAQNKADEETKALGEQVRTDTQNAIGDYARKVTPRAAVASSMVEDPAGIHQLDAQPGYQPSQDDKRMAAFDLLGKMGGDPRDTGKMIVAQALKGGSEQFGKIEPKDYTPVSIAKFNQTGNFADLAPRTKVEVTGGTAYDPYSTAPGSSVGQTEVERELSASGLVRGSPEWNSAMASRVEKQTTHAPATQVNVDASTGKKYGEQFAGQIAQQDVGMLEAARKAPELANRANQVKEVLASGKVITGSGADYRLALGKALNLVGASDAETVSNTEQLSVNLARNTLDAIKASGLGGGTGFSNADRDFLEKAAGGKINLEATTIGRLADLSHRAAGLSADAWNKRVKDIPDAALTGTGIRRDSISVPSLFGAKGKPQISPEAQRYLDQYAPVVPGG